MPNLPPGSAPLFGRADAPGQRAVLAGLLWTAASLATAIVIFSLSQLVAEQKHREAGRTIVAEQKGADYVAKVVHGFAARHGQPAGF